MDAEESHRIDPYAIRPIVEFFPIERVRSKKGARWEFFDSSTPDGKKLRAELSAAHGLYVFYNSQCRAIYLGKARRMNFWFEAKSAYNRERLRQTVRKVDHAASRSGFQPAYAQPRAIKDHQFYLYEVAAYISIYEVGDLLINDLEALLMRAFPNELTNAKLERFRGSAGTAQLPVGAAHR
jgi:hypothetical protein